MASAQATHVRFADTKIEPEMPARSFLQGLMDDKDARLKVIVVFLH